MPAMPMTPIFEEKGRSEYPFPPMDAVEPSSSSSDTLPSALSGRRSSQSRSARSSPAPAPRRSRNDAPRDRERDREYNASKSRLLSRLYSREERDINHFRTMLVVTSERLENETRRADNAENRVIDTLQKLRQAREATMLAQADAARANEEVRMYKLRLEEAQREIFRAQEIVDRLEQDKVDAEAEAARARTLARKFREERVIEKAREEGRRQGYQEGLSRGKDMGYFEARAAPQRPEPRRYRRPPVEEEEFSEDEAVDDNDDGSGSQPEEIIPIPRSPQNSWPPPSRVTDSRGSQRRSPPRVMEDDRSARNPIAAPSPVRPPRRSPATPEPVPVPNPNGGRSRSRTTTPIAPVIVHNDVSSPSHPPVEIPPDNYIPYMGRDNTIYMPPPHELSRPVSPRSPSPSTSETAPRELQMSYEQGMRSRDFAYSHGPAPVPTHLSYPNVPFSPQSRTSTNISQYDLVTRNGPPTAGSSRNVLDALTGLRQMIGTPGPSRAGHERSKTPGRSSREDRHGMQQPGPPSREASPAPLQIRTQSPSGGRHHAGSGSPLERLFKKRFRNRTSGTGSSGGVPDITVESPSTGTVSGASTAGTVNQPHLLSPEVPHQTLPSSEDPANGLSSDQRPLPPLPEFDLNTTSVNPLLDGQLPAGFVPLTPPVAMMMNDDFNHGGIYAVDSTKPSPKPTPRGPAYEVAPLPPGVVYPDPPGRGITPFAAVGVPLPPSPSHSPGSSRRHDSLGRALSPLSSLELFSSPPRH